MLANSDLISHSSKNVASVCIVATFFNNSYGSHCCNQDGWRTIMWVPVCRAHERKRQGPRRFRHGVQTPEGEAQGLSSPARAKLWILWAWDRSWGAKALEHQAQCTRSRGARQLGKPHFMHLNTRCVSRKYYGLLMSVCPSVCPHFQLENYWTD